MGIALITIKIMPNSVEADLTEIKTEAKKVLEENSARNIRFEEHPIAFGLKAVMTLFEINEEDELEPIENQLAEIENVQSVSVTDMRRAFE